MTETSTQVCTVTHPNKQPTTAIKLSTPPSATTKPAIPVDDTTFTPSRVFYLLPHHIFSKETRILDLTRDIQAEPSNGPISDTFRNSARKLSQEPSISSHSFYTITADAQVKGRYSLFLSSEATVDAELASWKQPLHSAGEAQLCFPAKSPHSRHPLALGPPSWARQTNQWVQDSVQYEWVHDSRWRESQMTLHKTTGGRKVVVARFSKRWGSWVTGGVLIVDEREIDEVVAVLTCCVMVKKMQQRAAERRWTRSGADEMP